MQVKRIESSDSNVSKYVFDFGNAVAEAVLYKYPTYEERTVICCSTQSGCPVGCRFCGAGDAFVRSLTSEEIVAQVEYLFTERQINPAEVKRGQIMFMSMGEPLLNCTASIPRYSNLRKNNDCVCRKCLLLPHTSSGCITATNLITRVERLCGDCAEVLAV